MTFFYIYRVQFFILLLRPSTKFCIIKFSRIFSFFLGPNVGDDELDVDAINIPLYYYKYMMRKKYDEQKKKKD